MIKYRTISGYKNDLFTEIPLMSSGKTYKKFPLKAVISLKNAGDMGHALKDKLPNRSILFEHLRISDKAIFTVNQDHTKDVIHIKENNIPDDFFARTADGFVTDLGWPIMGVTVADCVPVLLFSKNRQAYGILHSGWKGTGIIEKALAVFAQEFGIRPESLCVCLGPAIGPCCYHVTKQRAEEFITHFGENTVEVRGGKYYLDLVKANINLLDKWGVQDINVIKDCTYCNPELSSFRRDGEQGLSRMLVLLGPFSLR